jgi:hypothetical protein
MSQASLFRISLWIFTSEALNISGNLKKSNNLAYFPEALGKELKGHKGFEYITTTDNSYPSFSL